jgi:hypothetical protein
MTPLNISILVMSIAMILHGILCYKVGRSKGYAEACNDMTSFMDTLESEPSNEKG